MRTRSNAVLIMSALLSAACDRPPTSIVLDDAPLLASGGSPRFTEAVASGPSFAGALAISFRLTGVGSKASDQVIGNASRSAVWACQTVSSGFDGFPAPQSVGPEPVSATTSLAMRYGQVSGSVALSAPANPLTCAVGGSSVHFPVLVSAAFTDVQVTHPDDATVSIPGTFERTFLALPQETFPVFTSVVPEQTTLTIEGGLVGYDATVDNPGGPRSPVLMQAWITQGTTFRAAGGGVVDCGGAAGELPTGQCNLNGSARAFNAGAGSGTLVPGPAVLEINLRDSPTIRVLAGWRVNVILQ